ncbi:hypothetical protein [Paenibacillus sp. HB172176]|uniref:hypothetical protein n=1 Tax=Paenibacillus sp. HB172176 TaxID=2493690 RepID=UPI0014387164|nr:hypothetical protein [Paenibacillus sp. HB172176]
MYKLLLIIAMMTLWLSVHLIQIEDELAMKTLFQSKRAVNRAVHAAAQQLDKTSLSEGELRIDPTAAAAAAFEYLQRNLQLDASNNPQNTSFLEEQVEVLVFDIINSDESFPYFYHNDSYLYDAVLNKPGVVMIIHVAFPNRFPVLEPMEWSVKGVSEIVLDL